MSHENKIDKYAGWPTAVLIDALWCCGAATLLAIDF